MAHLTADQWAAIRKVWEADPRDGFAWIVQHLELSVARQRVAKKAKDEGWQKAGKPLHDANLGAARGKKTIRAESAPAAPVAAGGKSSPRTRKPRGSGKGKEEGPGEKSPGSESAAKAPAKKAFKKTERKARSGTTSRNARSGVAQPEDSNSNSDSPKQWSGRSDIDIFRDPFGRPPEFKREYIEQAHKQCLLYGATDDQLAIFFEVSTRTIHRWKLDYPEFCHAVKAGKGIADGNVAYGLYQRAVGMHIPKAHVSNYQGHITITDISEYVVPDVSAAKTWLYNRQREHWQADPEPALADPSSLFPSEAELDQIYSDSREKTLKLAEVARERRERLGICSAENSVPVDATMMPKRNVRQRDDLLSPEEEDAESVD